jgi:hypothetical protein
LIPFAVTFIGPPAANANGLFANFMLPRNLVVTFTKQDVRQPEDRQLKRFDVQPRIHVEPTIYFSRPRKL